MDMNLPKTLRMAPYSRLPKIKIMLSPAPGILWVVLDSLSDDYYFSALLY